MKKLLIIVLFTLGCREYSNEIPLKKEEYGVNGAVIKTTVIENCEYFVCQTYHNYCLISHKGNCSKPIHSKQTLTIDTVMHINITKSKEELEEEKLQKELDELTLKLDKATRELNHNLNILEQYER